MKKIYLFLLILLVSISSTNLFSMLTIPIKTSLSKCIRTSCPRAHYFHKIIPAEYGVDPRYTTSTLKAPCTTAYFLNRLHLFLIENPKATAQDDTQEICDYLLDQAQTAHNIHSHMYNAIKKYNNNIPNKIKTILRNIQAIDEIADEPMLQLIANDKQLDIIIPLKKSSWDEKISLLLQSYFSSKKEKRKRTGIINHIMPSRYPVTREALDQAFIMTSHFIEKNKKLALPTINQNQLYEKFKHYHQEIGDSHEWIEAFDIAKDIIIFYKEQGALNPYTNVETLTNCFLETQQEDLKNLQHTTYSLKKILNKNFQE